VTIILGGDSLIHNKTKDPEINRGFAAPPRGCDNLAGKHYNQLIVLNIQELSMQYVANLVAAGLIKSFPFVKCLSMEMRIVLEYMYEVILLPLAIVT